MAVADNGVIGAHNHLAVVQLWVMQDICNGANRCSGDIGFDENIEPCATGFLFQDMFNLVFKHLMMFGAGSVGCEFGLLEPMGLAEGMGAFFEQGIVTGGDSDRLVFGLERIKWRDRRMTRAGWLGFLLLCVIACDSIFEQGDLAIEHRYIDTLAVCRVFEGGDDTDGCEQSRSEIADGHTDSSRVGDAVLGSSA